MNDLKVSVIITTYKRDEPFLERAILSVVNQSHSSIELIIVDDNGTASPYHKIVTDLVEKYHHRYTMKHIIHENNQGAQRARNNGIRKATGDYIAFLDDDDEWLEEKIEKQLRVFKESAGNDVGLVYCWYNVLTESTTGEKSKKIVELPEYKKEDVIKELARSNFIASTSFPLIKAKCFETVGLFDEELEASQDYDMWIRIVEKFEIRCAKMALANYYKHQGERITSDNNKKARAEKSFLSKHYEVIKRDDKAFSDKNKKIGIYLMRQGKGKESRKYLRESIKIEPIALRVYKYYIESFYLQWKNKE